MKLFVLTQIGINFNIVASYILYLVQIAFIRDITWIKASSVAHCSP